MVKLGRLWGDAKFASLSPNSKLLYCYLISQPNITTLGILDLYVERINLDVGIHSPEEFKHLKEKGFIDYFWGDEEDTIAVLVLGHYPSLAKSKLNMRKGLEEGQESKGRIRDMLLEVFHSSDFKNDEYVPPTPREVADYALSLGYLVNGKNFVEYYADNDWYDKNNKLVRNWKTKVSKVWCRETNKLETADGAPKGYEYFFVELDEGNKIYPTAWVGGIPTHYNHIYAQYLIDEYNEQISS